MPKPVASMKDFLAKFMGEKPKAKPRNTGYAEYRQARKKHAEKA